MYTHFTERNSFAITFTSYTDCCYGEPITFSRQDLEWHQYFLRPRSNCAFLTLQIKAFFGYNLYKCKSCFVCILLSPYIWVVAPLLWMGDLPFISSGDFVCWKISLIPFYIIWKIIWIFLSIYFIFVNISFLSDIFWIYLFFLLASHFPLVLIITYFDSSLLVVPRSPWKHISYFPEEMH